VPPQHLLDLAGSRRILRLVPDWSHGNSGEAHLRFFNKNLVMEYGHEQAVADGVNVDFDVYNILTRITKTGQR